MGSVLDEIKGAVVASGYQPIMVAEFDFPEAATRDSSLRLLRQCKFAIFEVTMDGGTMMEIGGRESARGASRPLG